MIQYTDPPSPWNQTLITSPLCSDFADRVHRPLGHLTYLMFGGAMVMTPGEGFWLVDGVGGGEASHWSVPPGQAALTVKLVLSRCYDGHGLTLT